MFSRAGLSLGLLLPFFVLFVFLTFMLLQQLIIVAVSSHFGPAIRVRGASGLYVTVARCYLRCYRVLHFFRDSVGECRVFHLTFLP